MSNAEGWMQVGAQMVHLFPVPHALHLAFASACTTEVVLHLAINSHPTKEFLRGDNKESLNQTKWNGRYADVNKLPVLSTPRLNVPLAVRLYNKNREFQNLCDTAVV